jgi:predicted Zn-dependent protease with MMP-like domain
VTLDEFTAFVQRCWDELPDEILDALVRKGVTVSVSEAQPQNAQGVCVGYRDVVLFYPWLNDQSEGEIRRTFLHEIGHACGFTHANMPAELMRAGKGRGAGG